MTISYSTYTSLRLPLHVDAFVVCDNYPEFGVGKLLSVGDKASKITYFDSPIRPSAKVVFAPNKSIHRLYALPEQTRVYLTLNDCWFHGRVLNYDPGLETYHIRLPNKQNLNLDVSEFYVRWDQNPSSPIDLIASMVWETPLFHTYRHQLTKNLVRQRNASIGMSGYISSKIQLASFQFHNIFRILQDPVQRYLIGDEVGLGKTIIAGTVIRQLFLDSPSAKVVVVVPKPLLAQWEQELRYKFSLGEMLSTSSSHPGSVTLLSLQEFSQRAHHMQRESFSMIVMDEAHHLSQMAWDATNEVTAEFQAIQALTQASPKLLLLTATPVLRNEDGFLAMLNLLDPMIYRLEDRESFRASIQQRENVEKLCHRLKTYAIDEYNPVMLEAGIALDSFLKEDSYLRDRIYTLMENQLPAELTEQQRQGFREARNYLLERYRLHRRILRTRRAKNEAIKDFLMGRGGVQALSTDDSQQENSIDASMMSWCNHGNPDATEWQEFFLHCLETSWNDERILRALLSFRRFGEQEPLLELLPHTGADWLQSFQDLPQASQDEQHYLDTMLDTLPDPEEALKTKLYRLLQELRENCHFDSKRRFIIFCNEVCTADWLYQHFSAEVPGAPSIRYKPKQEQGLSHLTSSRFIFCDKSAEEGLNLQSHFTSTVVHFDMVLDPNRLEQRMGRCDRFGGHRVDAWVLLHHGTGSMQHLFFDVLLSIGLFEHSISNLQYWINDWMAELRPALAFKGHDALRELNDKGVNAKGAKRESKRIQKQDVFERAAESNLDPLVQERFAALAWGSSEEDTRMRDDLFHAAKAWLDRMNIDAKQPAKSSRNLDKKPAPLFCLRPRGGNHKVLLPQTRIEQHIPSLNAPTHKLWLTNMDRTHLLTKLMNRYRLFEEHPDELQFIELPTIGSQFIEGLRSWMAWDDRGQSFGMWRWAPSLSDEQEGAFLRLDVILEANSDVLEDMLESWQQEWNTEHVNATCLTRRSDFWFPPTLKTFFVCLNTFRFVTADEPLHSLLSRPYEKIEDRQNQSGDKNLSSRRMDRLWTMLDEFPTLAQPIRDIENVVPIAASRSEEQVHDMEEVRALQDKTIRQLESQKQILQDQFRIRTQGLDPNHPIQQQERMYHDFEVKLLDALHRSIKPFRIRFDSAGLILLSNKNPFGSR